MERSASTALVCSAEYHRSVPSNRQGGDNQILAGNSRSSGLPGFRLVTTPTLRDQQRYSLFTLYGHYPKSPEQSLKTASGAPRLAFGGAQD